MSEHEFIGSRPRRTHEEVARDNTKAGKAHEIAQALHRLAESNRAPTILDEIATSIRDTQAHGSRHQAPGYWTATEVEAFNVLHDALNPVKGSCDECGGTFIDPAMRGLCSECE